MYKISQLSLFVALSSFSFLPMADAQANPPVDMISFDHMPSHSLRIEGDNSRLVFSNDPSKPFGAYVVDHGGGDCHMALSSEHQDDHVILKLSQSRRGLMYGLFSTCDTIVAINLGADMAIDLALDKLVIDLSGTYRALRVKADDAVLDMSAAIQSLDVTARNLVANIKLNEMIGPESVTIHSDVLMLNVGYPKQTSLDYRIDAPVILFGRGVPDSPTSKTKLTISSKILKGSTYFVPS